MKVFAAHNLRGEIDHLVVTPPDTPPGAVSVASGHLVTEVDAQQFHLDATKAEGLEKLAEMIRSHRVNIKSVGELVKKT